MVQSQKKNSELETALHPEWALFFNQPPQRDLRRALEARLATEREEGTEIYPPQEALYEAFSHTGPRDTHVVIVGQDPYHGPGQAMGLAFGVSAAVKVPPSLRNIFKELARDGWPGCLGRRKGDLSGWARQGVMLLNSALSVRAGEAGSHARLGWHDLTDAAIRAVSDASPACVFMLWGRHAQGKVDLIDGGRHCVLTAAHPSPLSAHRGFLGCGHFSAANAWLSERGINPIDWGAE